MEREEEREEIKGRLMKIQWFKIEQKGNFKFLYGNKKLKTHST